MRFVMQLGMLGQRPGGIVQLGLHLFIALLPFLFIFKMQKRERSWIIGLTAIYLCIGVLLTIIMNTTPDRQSADEQGVFHRVARGGRHHDRLRAGVDGRLHGHALPKIPALGIAGRRHWPWCWPCIASWCATGKLYFGPAGEISLSGLAALHRQAFDKDQYGLPVFANLILLAMPVIFIDAPCWSIASAGRF